MDFSAAGKGIYRPLETFSASVISAARTETTIDRQKGMKRVTAKKTAAKKAARKGATKKATRKGATKKATRKGATKKATRKGATKKAARKWAGIARVVPRPLPENGSGQGGDKGGGGQAG
jgi:hypothetical protein